MWTGKAAEEDDDCLDWFMVTTTYNSEGEVIGEDWEYLYTSCNMNSGGGSGSGGNTGGGGGGGGNGSNNGTNGSVNGSGPQPGTPVFNLERIFNVKHTAHWEVNAMYYFDGIRYQNPILDQFTAMRALQPSGHGNIGIASDSNHIWHSTWYQINNSHNIAPTTAYAAVSGVITYVNQAPPSNIDVISNNTNWTAKAVIN